MKAIFDKAKRSLGVSDVEVRESTKEKSEIEHRSDSLPIVESCSDLVHLPSSNYSFEKESQIGPDAVLFSKSGVCFKYPAGSSLSFRNVTEKSKPEMDGHISVPGYLFIASRGSNFGTTLILNWVSSSALTNDTCFKQKVCTDLEKSHINSDNQISWQKLQEGEKCHSSSGDPSHDFSGSMKKQSCEQHSVTSENLEFSVSIDLFTTEVIRIFYRKDQERSTGEMVVKCDDQVIKVFYFKNGGIEDLIQLLLSWKYLKYNSHSDSNCFTFTVEYPKFNLDKLHPLENKMSVCLTDELWSSVKDSEGRIMDYNYFCKVVFFKGVSPGLRKDVWPVILKVYGSNSTDKERKQLKQDLMEQYQELSRRRTDKRIEPCGEARNRRIYDDILRTDRNIPYYKGEDNPNLQVEMNLILNFLHCHPNLLYVQGMTDFLAPMLSVLDDESMAFWCFSRFMDAFNILSDALFNIKHHLDLLRLLVKLLLPQFFAYLKNVDEGLSLMFCHRWLLVYLKREFNDQDILQIWESCWTAPTTRYFHLFICVAIIAVYSDKAWKKQMTLNELMIYFNSLSLQMPVNVVLTQARGYLHQFSCSKQLDCAFHVLMEDSFWQQTGSPTLNCATCQFATCSSQQLHPRTESLC